jgi:hypothetical protein
MWAKVRQKLRQLFSFFDKWDSALAQCESGIVEKNHQGAEW